MMLRAAIVGCLLLLAPAVSFAQTSLAVPEPSWCLHEGTSVWTAQRPAQNDLARVTVDLRCVSDQPSLVRVKAETRCGRALCSWSFAETASADGTRILATFFTFAATREMRLELNGDRVSVLIENDYNQEGRQSDTMQASLKLER